LIAALAATAGRAAPAPVERSPATWLSAAGKSDAWRNDTQECRELLARLDLQDARVKRHLPRIEEKAEVLRRVNSFDWRTRTALEFLRGMLQDLAAGKTPLLRYAGKGFGYPYWSNTMRRIEATWVHVPPSYDPGKSHQLFLFYKCGGGIHLKDGKAAGGYRPDERVANQTDTFHAWSSLDIQVKGRYGAQIEVEEFPAALSRDFSVDPDRVFLSGWSDGGFTALMLAAHYPHLVAGIAPLCANWQYANVENVALRNIPVLTVDGWGDGGYNSGQFLRWQSLRGWGSDASCVWGHHGHAYQPYEDIEEFQYILDWARTKKRNPWPKQVHYATWNLAWNRAYWVYLDRLIDPMLAGQIDVELKEGNRIEVRTWNLAAYHLVLGEKLVDPGRNVTIVTDGKESYAGAFHEWMDVELVKTPEGKFIKSAEMPDEIAAVMDAATYRRSSSGKEAQVVPGRTWLAVRGTAADEATRTLLEQWYPPGAKADSDVTDADIAGQNLYLYGGPDVNKLTARIAAELPVKCEKGKFTLGATVYDRPTHCIAFLHPNPLNPKKYVIVYAFNDAAAFASNGYLGLTVQREFRTGDAMVRGIPAPRPKFGAALDGSVYQTRYAMFGPDWKPDSRPPLGEAEKPFDYLQLLRLRADALREAAGVDVGIVWEHVPPWNRWNTSLAAGPVTMADLATQDQLPEYVCVGEMRGADLAGRRSGAAATSLPADIDPGKTYRVAFAFNGVPSYGAEPDKMPKLFKWTTPEEFLAGPGTRIPVRNLVETPLQVAEAVAQYVRKHRKIAPRPVCDSLTEYIANPCDNDYGGSDWLHLGVDVLKPGARACDERYTLAVGVRAAGEPDPQATMLRTVPAPAPPRKNAKQFLELALQGPPARFDFAALDRKLPVTAASVVRRYAVTVDKERKTCALAAPEADGAIGHAVLVESLLANKGQTDVALTAVLSNTVISSVFGQTWPEDSKGKAWYAGYHRATGPAKQPPRHEEAALLLCEGKPRTLIAHNAGYNFGLVGMAQDLTVKAGQSVSVPLLLISIDRPAGVLDIKLATALESLKGALLRRDH
jgi:pimeloyl-ACP methyl ester carboxylesterase